MTVDTSAPRTTLLGESLIFAGRHVAHWRRMPAIPLQSILLPTVLLVVYYALVGESMKTISGTDNLEALVPMCAIAGGMFGALGAAFSVPFERSGGLLARWWALPIHRTSILVGRLMAEALRTVMSTVVITCVGLALGLRFEGSWMAMVGFVLVPVLVVVVFATFILTFALAAGPNVNALFTYLSTFSIGLVFSSSGVAPIELFPTWVQPFIQYQPMSVAIESMRAFVQGTSAVRPLALTFAWFLAFAAVFVPLTLRRYRLAAAS